LLCIGGTEPQAPGATLLPEIADDQSMAAPIIETKLTIPGRRSRRVERGRLGERLTGITSSKLTLVSAPPGFGKSTLVADWARAAAGGNTSVAWLSLDAGDNDPGRFWSYVVAALRADQPFVDVATLVNALTAATGEIVLVLDDLHVIENPAIHDGLAQLIDRLPDTAHVVVTTRADPPLPLARLRARGELLEIRAADLRFTPDEAAAFLNDVMGLDLSGADVAALEARTEGWVAALQLAGLSMTGREDVGAFVAQFAGDDRYVVDYLADEVLARQPAATRAFLMETAVLDRLTAGLCDAMTGRDDSRAVLEGLDRANLFLVALDDQRRWYRYHHLFADVLRARLLDEQPALVPELHSRASAWFEANGDRPAAIEHALAAADYERAADLIEVTAHDLRQTRQEQTLRRWLDSLPDPLFEHRPVLAITHVAARMSSGTLEGVEQRLADAERWLPAARDEDARAAAVHAGMIVRHTAALSHLPSAIGLHRAGLAQVHGDFEATVEHARATIEFAGADQPLERGGASGLLALAYWSRGDLEAAHSAWSQAIVSLAEAGHDPDVLGCSIGLADIEITLGRLHDARDTYERGVRRSDLAPNGPLRGAADMHVGLGELHLEWNVLDEARGQLQAAEGLGEAAGLPQNAHRLRIAMARLREAEGRFDEAVQLLDEAERRYNADFFPDFRPIAAIRARAWLRQGRLAEAQRWARDAALSPDDELSYLREFDHLTLARVLVVSARESGSEEDARRAAEFLDRLVAAADAGRRRRSQAEALALAALARRVAGEREGSLDPLDGALALAEPEGFVRLFVDEDEPMLAILRERSSQRSRGAYLDGLIAAFGEVTARPATQGLVEPLSDRELEVLQLLAGDLTGPDIARELYISLNTLRTHTKNIFAKLGVTSRRAAVTQAKELGLLG
jgi:LuxR family transcriptional regulator, maltose regulon positive regulatory protein